ncbi:DNA-binding response regulator [Actinosynnema sp. ALI-1.44]|uniref:response regulator n=1 Tax=Actinosynnema sp. ALI-1.44 TaxID=1933779 RepID=UPI00097C9F94|nr:response regulator transcription factor [Actinosynnema sp. ALI-1.44]ONI87895.1 DNA-binding response regulator [Actinosynnema sp. ALI-1.44]
MSSHATGLIDVLIADDHPVYRSGLRTLLNGISSLRVVGEACTGTEALTMTYRLRPHLVLMDVNLPRINGIEATKTIASKCPDTSVIIVTMLEDKETFFAAIRAGARGYLLKGATTKDINRAIETVCSGSLLFDPYVSNWVVEYLTKPQASGKPFPELTDRERAVLELVADGKSNAAIARDLDLSIKTVRNYLSRIFAKLRLYDRTEAAVQARRAGLGH